MTLIFTLSCSDDELPAEENEEEAINAVSYTHLPLPTIYSV